jgi:hypothetical protein
MNTHTHIIRTQFEGQRYDAKAAFRSIADEWASAVGGKKRESISTVVQVCRFQNMLSEFMTTEPQVHDYITTESQVHDYITIESHAHDYITIESHAHDIISNESHAHDYITTESRAHDVNINTQ